MALPSQLSTSISIRNRLLCCHSYKWGQPPSPNWKHQPFFFFFSFLLNFCGQDPKKHASPCMLEVFSPSYLNYRAPLPKGFSLGLRDPPEQHHRQCKGLEKEREIVSCTCTTQRKNPRQMIHYVIFFLCTHKSLTKGHIFKSRIRKRITMKS